MPMFHQHFWVKYNEDDRWYYVRCACGATDKQPK